MVGKGAVLRTIAAVRPFVLLLTAAALAFGGCGGDDDEPAAPAPTVTTPSVTTPSETEPPAEPEEPKRERTPPSLADCIRSADGVSDVLLKGRDSEDARFFADLVGGRVVVLGVTLEGQSAEVSVFLFASAADARKAAPSAGGGGVEARAAGSAVVAGPPGAKAAAVDGCLRETGYG